MDVNRINTENQTPLMMTVGYNNTDMAKLLIKHGANLNLKNKNGNTALMNAAYNRKLVAVNFLLDKGADVNAKNNDGDTALIMASYEKKVEDISRSFEAFNRRIDNAANEEFQKDIIYLLLYKGADIKIKNKAGKTAADVSSKTNDSETATYLRKIEASNPLLVKAVSEGKLETVKSLLEKGGNVNSINIDEVPLIIIAVGMGHTKIIKLLLEKGAEINIRSDNYTALMIASFLGKIEIVKLLLEKGADVELKNAKGETAVKLAEEGKHTEIADLLRASR